MRGDFACAAGVFAKSDEIGGVHARCVNAPWKVGVCAYQGRRSERPGQRHHGCARCPKARRPSAVRLEVAVRDHPDAKMGPWAR